MKFMAFSLLYLLFLILPSLEASSSTHDLDNNLKSMHFTLYAYHNKTKADNLAYPGKGGPSVNDTTNRAPFGSIFLDQVSYTVTPDQTSKVVGSAESIIITNTMDGLNRMVIVKYTLDVEGHKGSISAVGGGINIKPTVLPINGGTGDFMFVQGYATYSLFTSNPKELSSIIKSEFHLFWPPYAALATKY